MADRHMEKAREIVIAASQDEGEESSLVRRIATALRDAERDGMRRGYLAGFNASGEGWNGEYPFQDQNRSPGSSLEWVVNRDRILAKAEGRDE